MDEYIANQFVDECLPAFPPFFVFGALNSMCQFDDAHYGQAQIDFTVYGVDLFEDLTDSLSQSLSRDDDGRIEDQSHEGGFHGLRLRMISSTSAAKSGSREGASPVSSS
jgi:hypothetical protein